MIDHKMIHQTDKEPQSQFNRFSQLWRDKNAPDGWTTNFLDDAAAEEWVRGEFEGSPVEWTWDFLHRGVLKADFLRYLLPLIRGGVYSDVDVSFMSLSTRFVGAFELMSDLASPEYRDLGSAQS